MSFYHTKIVILQVAWLAFIVSQQISALAGTAQQLPEGGTVGHDAGGNVSRQNFRDNLSACPQLQATGYAAESLPYKYVGNNFSHKFHRPSCPFAKAMDVEHVELFHFRKEAIDAGQSPCRYCLPPYWKTVESKLIPNTVRERPAPQPVPPASGQDVNNN